MPTRVSIIFEFVTYRKIVDRRIHYTTIIARSINLIAADGSRLILYALPDS